MSAERMELANLTDSNYRDDTRVMARWLMYGLFGIETETHIADDIEQHLERIGLVYPHIVDIGASNGSFLEFIGNRLYRFKPQLTAIEPNIGQYDKKRDDALSSVLDEIMSNYVQMKPVHERDMTIDWRVQRAETALPFFKDESIDIATCLFTMYHLDESSRIRVYDSIKKKLNPQGMFVVTTSGDDNKSGTRLIEERVARILGADPPAHMNAGFTSEKANSELAEQFRNEDGYTIRTLRQRNQLAAYDNKMLVEFTKLSVLSLADLFSPPQTANLSVFSNIVDIAIEKVIDEHYIETVDRSTFVITKEN